MNGEELPDSMVTEDCQSVLGSFEPDSWEIRFLEEAEAAGTCRVERLGDSSLDEISSVREDAPHFLYVWAVFVSEEARTDWEQKVREGQARTIVYEFGCGSREAELLEELSRQRKCTVKRLPTTVTGRFRCRVAFETAESYAEYFRKVGKADGTRGDRGKPGKAPLLLAKTRRAPKST